MNFIFPVKFLKSFFKNDALIFPFFSRTILLFYISVLDIFYLIFIKESSVIFFIFLAYFFIIFFIQTLFLFYLSRIRPYIFVFFLVLNIFVIKLSSFDYFFIIFNDIYKQFFLLTLIFFFFYIVYKISLPFLYLLLFISSLSSIFSIYINTSLPQKNEYYYDFLLPEFKQRPNFYLIGIDALGPFKLINNYLKSDINFDSNIKNNVYFYKNSYGHGSTWQTWPSILNLSVDIDLYSYSEGGREHAGRLFRGVDNSLLYEIFRKNSYEIISGFEGSAFGDEVSGSYINYFFNNIHASKYENFSQKAQSCLNDTKIFGIKRNYAICSNVFNRLIRKIFSYDNKIFSDAVLSIIQQNYSSDSPKLFVMHTLNNGHTSANFDYKNEKDIDEFKKIFLEGHKENKIFINNLINFIKTKDPNAIVLFFGDHGAWLLRKDWYSKKFELNIFKNNNALYNDQFANQIFLLKTDNKCSTNNIKDNDFNYHATVILDILSCISENNESKIFERKSPPGLWYHGIYFSDYKSILYE